MTRRLMKKLTIKGKSYPCRVTMGAMVRFKRESGKDVSQMEPGDLSDLVLFMWCCTASACNADGVEFGYTQEQFADSLEPSGVSGFYEELDEKKTEGTAAVTE